MIKNVVFDMGNVLILYDAQRFIDTYAPDPADGQLLMRNVFRSVEWIKMDRGSINQQEAAESICKRLPERLHPTVTLLLDNWHEDIPPFPEVEELCGRIKQAGYKLYLLSNTSAKYHRYRRHIGALRYFDGEFISADWGLLKPDPRIYYAFFQHFGLTPAECFFIDDAPANIEGAELAGMRGAVYHNDVVLLENQLLEAGVAL